MRETPLIAIVDDDKSIRNATQELLNAAGYFSIAFESAESFLSSANRARVACLIADMRMPGMSGLELREALVASGQRIPTLIITAHADGLIEARAREAGITCHLNKPFEPGELLKCVGKALAKSPKPRPAPRS